MSCRTVSASLSSGDRGRSNRLPTADEAKPIRDIIASWNARHKVVAQFGGEERPYATQ
jgi:hypothetical protein